MSSPLLGEEQPQLRGCSSSSQVTFQNGDKWKKESRRDPSHAWSLTLRQMGKHFLCFRAVGLFFFLTLPLLFVSLVPLLPTSCCNEPKMRLFHEMLSAGSSSAKEQTSFSSCQRGYYYYTSDYCAYDYVIYFAANDFFFFSFFYIFRHAFQACFLYLFFKYNLQH